MFTRPPSESFPSSSILSFFYQCCHFLSWISEIYKLQGTFSSTLLHLQICDAILVNWWLHLLFTKLTLCVQDEDVLVIASSTKHRALGTSSKSYTQWQKRVLVEIFGQMYFVIWTNRFFHLDKSRTRKLIQVLLTMAEQRASRNWTRSNQVKV